nr:hypothetical protein [Cedecea sp. FDAARGOS_727]
MDVQAGRNRRFVVQITGYGAMGSAGWWTGTT